MYAIIGSGFGLYGYLPALVEYCGEAIVLPARYRDAFLRRPELLPYTDSVRYESDEQLALDRADGVVIAQRPADQPAWVERALGRPAIRHLILEKPLAPSPDEASALLETLVSSSRSFRVGYVLRHTRWGKAVIREVRTAGELRITWSFMAHHYRHDLRNWKRLSSAGGGAVRFYGIQLMALLAEAGYSQVTTSAIGGESTEDISGWVANLTGPALPTCVVKVNCRSAVSTFLVEQSVNGRATTLVDAADPLSEPATLGESLPSGSDRRVPIVGDLCRSLYREEATSYEWYHDVIRLWGRVERASEYVGGEMPTALIAS